MIRRLQTTPWSTIGGIVFMLLFFTAMTRLFMSEDARAPIKAAMLLVVATLAAAKYLSGLPGAGNRWAAAQRQGRAWPLRLLALQPAEIFGMQQHVWRLVHGAIRWVLRRAPAAPPSGTPIPYLRRSSYGGLTAVMAIGLLIDIPAGYVIMKASGMSPEKLAVMHDALTVLTCWLLVLGAGDRYWLRAGAHALDGRILRLRLGARFMADIPVDQVVEAAEIPRARPVQGRRQRPEGLAITPLEQPNVRLTLAPGALASALYYGAAPQDTRVLRLRVDDPGALLWMLAEAAAGTAAKPAATCYTVDSGPSTSSSPPASPVGSR